MSLSAPAAALHGDADCNGAVAAADLSAVVPALFEHGSCADADITGDGVKRANDITAELKLLDAGPNESAQDKILDAIQPDGSATLDTARQLFQLAYGRLGGVTVPAGKVVEDVEGTVGLQAMLQHRDELSAADPTRLDDALDVNGPVGISILPGKIQALARRRIARPLQAAADPGLDHPLPPEGPDMQAFAARVNVWLPMIESLAGPFTLELDIEGYANRYPPDCDAAQGTGCNIADTLAFDANKDPRGGAPVSCRIRFFQNYLDKTPDLRDNTVVHELWHCFEAQILDDCNTFVNEAGWIIEGESEYVGAKLTNTRSGSFFSFLSRPAIPLFTRKYSAVGFYVTMENDGTDMFPALKKVLDGGSGGGDLGNTLAFDLGALATTPRLLDTWGEREFEVTTHGGDWDYLIATGLPPPASDTIPGAVNLDMDDGAFELVQTPAYSVFLWKVKLSTDFLHFQVMGSARALDADGNEFNDLSDLWLCAHSDPQQCKCPEGSDGMAPESQPVSGLLQVAASAGDNAVSGTMASISLDQLCKQKPTPTPSPFCADAQGLQKSIDQYAGQGLDPPILQAELEADVHWLELMAQDAPADIAGAMQPVAAAYVTANADFASIGYEVVPMSSQDELTIQAALQAVAAIVPQAKQVGDYVAKVCGFQFAINGV